MGATSTTATTVSEESFLTAALKQAIGALAGGDGSSWPLELIHLSQDLICICLWDDRRVTYLNDAGMKVLEIGG